MTLPRCAFASAFADKFASKLAPTMILPRCAFASAFAGKFASKLAPTMNLPRFAFAGAFAGKRSPASWLLLNDKPQFFGVLALAAFVQECLKAFAQVFGRGWRTALQQCLLDVFAGDTDLFQTR